MGGWVDRREPYLAKFVLLLPNLYNQSNTFREPGAGGLPKQQTCTLHSKQTYNTYPFNL